MATVLANEEQPFIIISAIKITTVAPEEEEVKRAEIGVKRGTER